MDANNIMTGIPLHVYEPEEEDYSVYIVLSKTQTLPSRVIKLWTREPYAHTSLAMDVELTMRDAENAPRAQVRGVKKEVLQEHMYSFARKHLHNPFDCGFINEDITTGVFGRDVQTTCRIGRLRVTKQQYEKIMEILEQFKSEKAFYRYNYLGILGVMCQRSVERRYNYFCSQFVSYVLRKAGISLIMKKPGLTCPRDFRMCDDLEIIYEGKLRNYRNYLKLYFLRDAETGDYIVN